MNHPAPGDLRQLLLEQLEIPWLLATSHHLPAIDEENVRWEPSGNIVTLRRVQETWSADFPDEERHPLPQATIGWLLWHIEWWWTNALRGVDGDSAIAPGSFHWSGSADSSRARLVDLHDRWLAVLKESDLERLCSAPWPTPQPLWRIAAWVNVELMKNVAEIGQLLIRHANSTDPRA